MAMAKVLHPSTTEAVQARLEGRRNYSGRAFHALLLVGLSVSLLILGALVYDVVTNGWGVLADRFTSFLGNGVRTQPDEAGVFQGMRGTFWLAVMVIVLAFPLGIGAAVYLEEYAPKNGLTRFVDINIRNLAGVPSVVYGILGLTIFVERLGDLTKGRSLISGGITLAILVLPIVIITSAEAIRAVPQTLREAGYGVGATKSQVIRNQVLPYAAPGILTGTLLSLSRAIGEAAPLILVGAIDGRLATGSEGWFDPGQLTEKFTAMPIVITRYATLPDSEFQGPIAAASIVVLLVFVLALNSVAILLRNRFEKKRNG